MCRVIPRIILKGNHRYFLYTTLVTRVGGNKCTGQLVCNHRVYRIVDRNVVLMSESCGVFKRSRYQIKEIDRQLLQTLKRKSHIRGGKLLAFSKCISELITKQIA